jgi:hypothetical protein
MPRRAPRCWLSPPKPLPNDLGVEAKPASRTSEANPPKVVRVRIDPIALDTKFASKTARVQKAIRITVRPALP